ncbi:MAG: hypothetical protein ACKO1M_11175, partial [Planctomycetota bacterium]
ARPADQSRVAATTFATGLSFPTSMAELADGSLLVAESAGTSLFGSMSGLGEVHFDIGAVANRLATPPNATVALSGGGLTFSPPAVVADSIRRLRVSDAVGNRSVSFSADELNRIPAAAIDQTAVDFGFADTYVRYADGMLVNPRASATDPPVAFLPSGGRRSEGAVEIAMAPAGFGSEFAGGVFTAFYGMSGQAGLANEENPLVFADPATGEYFHFVPSQVHGHLYGMLSTANSLFVSDLTWIGKLDGAADGVAANEAGVVYRITPVPEPAVGVAVICGSLLLLAGRLEKARE